MSPNPGEPGHELYGWTHRICGICYAIEGPRRGWPSEPHRVVGDEAGPCCYCGLLTSSGIYVRQDAREVHQGV